MDKKIPYISRNYDDYRSALIDLSKKYYPDMDFNFDDASVGSWFIDLNATIADELSYHIDRAYQETNINSAMKNSSLFTMARNMGFKVPGPKSAMCEVAFKCNMPLDPNNTFAGPDPKYYPVIKRGTKVTSGSQTFELLEDLDFSKQFSDSGVSNRLIQPIRDSNMKIVGYSVTKYAVVVGGETNIYKKYISASDVVPFMDILIPAENVTNVESVVVKEGSSFQSNPTMGEFYMTGETATEDVMCNGASASTKTTTYRFFEVDSLSQQQIWDTDYDNNGVAKIYEVDGLYAVTKGIWKTVNHKFVTEFTDNGYLKITFGSGVENPELNNATSGHMSFAEYQMSRMVKNDSLGYLPNPDTTVFILYRSGGGKSSNVAKGAINNISYLNAEINTQDPNMSETVKGRVISSISVESTMESVSGKDMPTADELKNLIKYSTAAQERCVTLKDYVSRVYQMPAKYGCPFRVSAIEENNKVVLYVLGVDSSSKLTKSLPVVMVENIENYLSKYRSINDFVEIRPGKIINLVFCPKVIIDKNYSVSDVLTNIKSTIMNYMDIRKHQMGEDIFVGDLEKEISRVDGVVNLAKLDVWNIFDNGHSVDRITQPIMADNCADKVISSRLQLDLDASDGVLYCDGDTMLEIKDTTDIEIQYKLR